LRQECPTAKTPEVGEAAPDFTLPGGALADAQAVRGQYALSGMRGAPVVLAFYPGDDTFVCTRELCSYSAGLAGFAELTSAG
jgi:peroxiredoxin Q/BCP